MRTLIGAPLSLGDCSPVGAKLASASTISPHWFTHDDMFITFRERVRYKPGRVEQYQQFNSAHAMQASILVARSFCQV